MTPLGSLSCDETIFPVSRVYLAYGQFVIRGELRGPLRAGSCDRYTLHDRDGALVYRSGLHTTPPLTWPETAAGETAWVEARVSITGRQSVAVPS